MNIHTPKAVDPTSRELRHTSVSALQRFNPEEYGGCETKWWLRYVMGIKDEQTGQKLVGLQGHAQVEHYLQSGQDVLGPIAAAGAHLLPPPFFNGSPTPGVGLLVEWGLNDKPRPEDRVQADGTKEQVHHFPPGESLLHADGLPLIGFVDLINLRGWYMTPEGLWVQEEPATVEVADHKFTSNIAYAKTGAELVKSTQMVGYAEFLTKKVPGLKQVRVSHNSYQTQRSRAAVKTTALISLATIASAWEKRGHSVVRRMRGVAQIEHEADVPGNLQSCNAYNKPCDYISHCSKHKQLNPMQRMKTMAGLLAKRQAAATSAAGTPGETPWIPLPPPVAPRRVEIQDQTTAQHAVNGHAYRFSTGTVGMFLSRTEDGYYSFLPVVNGAAGGQPFPVGADEPVVCLTPPAPPAAVAPPPPAPPAPPSVSRDAGAPPPPPPLAPPAPKRGPGRPKKGEEKTGPLMLFVNAVPNGPFEDLHQYANEVLAQMHEEFKVADIRCAPQDSALAYNKWRGVLAAAVRAGPPPSATYAAFTKGNELLEVIADAVAGLCGPGQYVRGV